MAIREDGKETRLRLLKAACEAFAAKGFRDARIADICKQAGVNVASVNYHFGDKASLYKEVWLHLLGTLVETTAPALAPGSAPERLRAYIHSLVKNFSAEGTLGQFSRIYLREVVSPTGLIQDAWHDIIEPRRQVLHGILRELMAPGAGALQVRLCEQSIIHQCRALVTVKASDLAYMLGRPLDEDLITLMADHIVDFSLAGIRAVGGRGLTGTG